MKLQILSDLHTEFHQDKGISWAKSLDSTDIDMLVIAGDLGLLLNIEPLFDIICEKYPQVIYTVGNHEYYYSDWEEIAGLLSNLSIKKKNLFVSDTLKSFKDDNILFLVGPLWFNGENTTSETQFRLNDFNVIDGFRNWYSENNSNAIQTLEKEFSLNSKSKIVVITHHLPSEKCSDPIYIGSPLQPFFVNNLDYLIEEYQPVLWIHGHTHTSNDFYIGKTRLVCNPFGYANYEINSRFKEKLVIEI